MTRAIRVNVGKDVRRKSWATKSVAVIRSSACNQHNIRNSDQRIDPSTSPIDMQLIVVL
jgi:hypothetical protein